MQTVSYLDKQAVLHRGAVARVVLLQPRTAVTCASTHRTGTMKPDRQQNKAVGVEVSKYFRHDLRPSTKAAYVQLTRKLWKEALQRDEQDLLTWDWDRADDMQAWHGRWTRMYKDKLIKWILDGTLKHTTKRNYMNALHMTLQGDDYHQEDTKHHIKHLNTAINQREGEQRRDEREQKWGMSHEEHLELLQVLFEEVQALPCYKEGRPITLVERHCGHLQVLYDWLALACYVLQPPLRTEWSKMHMLNKDTEPDEALNHLCIDEHPNVLLINHDKVSARVGPDAIDVSLDLEVAIALSRIFYPRTYVFSSFTDATAPHGNVSFILKNIRHPKSGKTYNQGVQLLRSSYITWFYDQHGVDHNAKVDLADKMRHSWQMAEVNYRKIAD